MKLTRLILKDYRMFRDLDIDFTYPEGHEKAGQPLEKVCFIGRNGTGKTTLLQFIREMIISPNTNSPNYKFKYVKFLLKNDCFSVFDTLIVRDEVLADRLLGYLNDKVKFTQKIKDFQSKLLPRQREFLKLIELKNGKDLLTFSPSDMDKNSFQLNFSSRNLSLNSALQYFNTTIPYPQEVSPETINSFWTILTYQVKKRESDLMEFLRLPENRKKSIDEMENIFDKNEPKILQKLSELWEPILDKAGLFFDYEKAKIPVQLSENLLAYIKLKQTNAQIPYQMLSSGIRSYIFRIGHIYSLYFNRNIERGFLLVDEPENSLFPDFLYDLVDTYKSVTQNTQIFMATHSPIIAAQFDPAERVILDFDDEGYVTARRGMAPEGDDPNDLLRKDFGVRSLMGAKGRKKWEEYMALYQAIQVEKDPETKQKMMDEMVTIGLEYGFSSRNKV